MTKQVSFEIMVGILFEFLSKTQFRKDAAETKLGGLAFILLHLYHGMKKNGQTSFAVVWSAAWAVMQLLFGEEMTEDKEREFVQGFGKILARMADQGIAIEDVGDVSRDLMSGLGEGTELHSLMNEAYLEERVRQARNHD